MGKARELAEVATAYTSGGLQFRNRIINGDMRIDQRNNGASVTGNGGVFAVDRFVFEATQTSRLTGQRNAGGVTPPAGFTNYLGVTSSSAYSPIATDQFTVRQIIEGHNTADLNFGAANASSITLSFWVRSSLTGTFAGVISNGASSRNYPYTYTVSASNTWEYKTITIPGDTSGTWGSDNGRGVQVRFSLGVGSNFLGTAGAWTSSEVYGVTGAVNLVSTNGATFFITGVQLEAGSVATPFERRPFGTELQLCQRYYEKSYDLTTVPGTNTILGAIVVGGGTAGQTTAFISGNPARFQVTKRAAPTVAFYDPAGTLGVMQRWQLGILNSNGQSGTVELISQNAFLPYSSTGTNATGVQFHYTASAEL